MIPLEMSFTWVNEAVGDSGRAIFKALIEGVCNGKFPEVFKPEYSA